MRPGLLDTSVVVDWGDPDVHRALPADTSIAAVTAAELSAGPALASTRQEAARRQALLQTIESVFEPLPFEASAARSYGRMAAAILAQGRHPRGRFADLLIAATAHANGLDLYTRNGADFRGLEDLIRVVEI